MHRFSDDKAPARLTLAIRESYLSFEPFHKSPYHENWAALKKAHQDKRYDASAIYEALEAVDPAYEHFSPIRIAALYRIPSLLTFLSEAEHSPLLDETDAYGWTALHYACWYGYSDIIEILLAEGADPTCLDKKGYHPLMIAIKQGHSESAMHLLKSPAVLPAINQVDRTCSTALIEACKIGDLRLTQKLLALGANPLLYDHTGSSPLIWAIARDLPALIDLLLQQESVFATLNRPETGMIFPLLYATCLKHVPSIKQLLHYGADPMQYNSKGLSAMACVLEQKSHSLLDLFLKQKRVLEDIDRPICPGFSAFFLAIMNEYGHAIQKLIIAGANPTLPDAQGVSPLMFAIKRQSPTPIIALLSNIQVRKKVDAQDERGWTALHYACEVGDPHTTLTLLSSGANPSLADEKGQTPMMYAVLHKHRSVIDVLLERNDDDTALLADQDKHGRNALMYACLTGDTTTAQKLLAFSAPPLQKIPKTSVSTADTASVSWLKQRQLRSPLS